MDIPTLGSLHPHESLPEWLSSAPVSIPYFDGEKLIFTLDGLGKEDEADVRAAVGAFLNLGLDARLAASHQVFKNYQRMADLVDEDDLGCHIPDSREVWQHVHPTEVLVSRRHRRDRAVYIVITAECDWEPEHGLQIVYRGGSELSRVSDQDGHLTHTDAYDLPEDQDRVS